jgi:hypothetical protein
LTVRGGGDVHDKQRGVDGSYKKAMQTLLLLSKLKHNYNTLHLFTGFTLTSENCKYAPIVQRISYRHEADFSIRPVNVSEHYYQNVGENTISTLKRSGRS